MGFHGGKWRMIDSSCCVFLFLCACVCVCALSFESGGFRGIYICIKEIRTMNRCASMYIYICILKYTKKEILCKIV